MYCRRCRYCLDGIAPEGLPRRRCRCPECGEPFDPDFSDTFLDSPPRPAVQHLTGRLRQQVERLTSRPRLWRWAIRLRRVGICLTVVWSVLCFVDLEWRRQTPPLAGGSSVRTTVFIGGGSVGFVREATIARLLHGGWSCRVWTAPEVIFAPRFWRRPMPAALSLVIPLYLPALLALAPWATLRALHGRPNPDECTRCGYDLCGLKQRAGELRICPECGKPQQ